MAEVVRLKRKVRPLTATYQPLAPYVVERHDQDDGSITYEVWDHRPGSYRRLCSVNEWNDSTMATAKHDADQIVRGLNMLVQFGKEDLPKMPDET